jgi:hypothetical protein
VSGLLMELSDQASFGRPAAGVYSSEGKLHIVTMPCDCQVVKGFVAKGAVMEKGQPIMAVMPKGGAFYVNTETTIDVLSYLKEGGSASLSFADGSVGAAKLLSVLPVDSVAKTLKVTLSSQIPLAASQLGEPVTVTFDTWPSFWASVRGFAAGMVSTLVGRGA